MRERGRLKGLGREKKQTTYGANLTLCWSTTLSVDLEDIHGYWTILVNLGYSRWDSCQGKQSMVRDYVWSDDLLDEEGRGIRDWPFATYSGTLTEAWSLGTLPQIGLGFGPPLKTVESAPGCQTREKKNKHQVAIRKNNEMSVSDWVFSRTSGKERDRVSRGVKKKRNLKLTSPPFLILRGIRPELS